MVMYEKVKASVKPQGIQANVINVPTLKSGHVVALVLKVLVRKYKPYCG